MSEIRCSAEPVRFEVIHHWQRDNPHWQLFGAVAPGQIREGGRRGPAALLVGGYDRTTGILDVVEADLRPRPPTHLTADLISAQYQYSCRVWMVERTPYRAFFRQSLRQRSHGAALPVWEYQPTLTASERIATLWQPLTKGLIRLRPHQDRLLKQLRLYNVAPGPAHGLATLQLLWYMVTEGADN